MAARFLNSEMLRDREVHTISPLEALKEVLLVDGNGWHSTLVGDGFKAKLDLCHCSAQDWRLPLAPVG